MGQLISSDFTLYLELGFHNPAGLCLEILMVLLAVTCTKGKHRPAQTTRVAFDESLDHAFFFSVKCTLLCKVSWFPRNHLQTQAAL